MKKKTTTQPKLVANNTQEHVLAENSVPTAFICPPCMMGDTCSQCSQFGSDGRCNKHGGYVDASHWACPWYYSH